MTPGTAKIPERADPAVRFVLEAILAGQQRGERRAALQIEADADLGHDTVRKWFYQRHVQGPRIGCVRRVLNALGYDLQIVKLT